MNQNSRAGRLVRGMANDGFELVDPAGPAPAKTDAVGGNVEGQLIHRLDNWRAAVRTGAAGGADGCATSWAAAYVAARNDREKRLAIELQIIQPVNGLCRESADILDGWLVEAAVRCMPHFDQKQALRLRYVWNYSNHFMKTKMRINDTSLHIVLGRARTNLKIVLDKLETPVKIRSNNSHARYVPRLEALAVPVGTPVPLESKEALID